MLTDKQVSSVCLLGAGAASCRYLESDPLDWRKFNCVKKLLGLKQNRDKTVKAYLELCKKQGVDPLQQYEPIGDNCSGYVYLKHIKQGIDIDRKKGP